MPTCPKCGQENTEVARFCLACGAELTAATEATEERKIITVLFADLVGFTSRAEQLDPEDVRAMLSPYYARLRTELERRGGTVEKFIGDAVMALFGAPVAHEDDPERAVRAALAIRDGLAELNESDPKLELQVRIAVNTGEALIALGAQPSEGEGMASGDVVNTAARLQASSPVNGILVGETTYRATERTIEYREAEAVSAKGKAQPIKAWKVLEPRARFGVDIGLRGPAPLIGRERELDVLLGALSRVRSESASQLVTLVGVPGIGKSRLVAELSAAVDEDPELIFWRQGRSLPYGEGVTFWALTEIVKAQAGILETDSAEAAREKLRRTVIDVVVDPTEAEWIESQLRPLLGLDEVQKGGDRQAETFGAWRRFFEHLAGRSPLVLVFEDMHWADDGLLDFVDDLVEWASTVRLLVVCIARPELLSRRPGWGGGKPNSTTLSLSPLTHDDTARLVAALLDQAVLPAELQAALLARAEGNPLYAEEYIRMLQNRGFLQREDDAWRFEGSDDFPLPETVQGIVAARLDSLSPAEKALVQGAAVLGKVFWAGAVAAVGGSERGAVEEHLRALGRKEFIRRERRSSVAGEDQYIFLHVLVRDVAYGQIPRARRAAKHRAAAGWIASLSTDRSEDRAEMLAHHYLSAIELAQASGQDPREFAEPARLALREAGDRALGLNAFAAAARFYDAALNLWPPDDSGQAQLLLRLGRARCALGEAAGPQALEEARESFLRCGDNASAAEADALIGKWYGDQGLRELEDEYLARASELVENVPASRSKAVTLTRVGTSKMLAGGYEEGIRIARESLQIADDLELDDIRARALNVIGFSRMTLGDPAGVDDMERAIAISLEHNLAEDAAIAYMNLAELFGNYFGDLERAFELRAEGKQLCEKFGLTGDLRFLEAERAVECYWTGRWDAADELADDLLSRSEQDAPGYMDSQCLLVKARIALARGDAKAFDYAGRALAVGRLVKDPQVVYPTLALEARAKVAAGRLEEARSLVDELLASWSGAPETLLASHLQSFPDLVVALRAVGRGPEFAEIAEGAMLKTKWLEAAGAFVSGDFLRAAAIYEETGSLPDEAYARLRAAEALMGTESRSEGDRELQRALAFYRAVDAKAYLREGEALLAHTA